ncbi:ATP-binding protein [Effusibacillus pohliae]|uniref:ATP-binding protein n=1 Tax=Effusibacillus pohliae TaxID=232270 RepID=UPI00036531C1|nr:ATP-binding protein [Effusibacillus pohliae]
MAIVSEEQLLKVLTAFNSWWTTGRVPKELAKPIKRFAFYEARQILHHPEIRRAVLLSGARRVGKTTVVYQLIEDLLQREVNRRHILYASFDHPVLKFCDIGRLLELYQNNIAPGVQEIYLFFDEVQYAKDWDHWMKILYDMNPHYRIVATGSASPVLLAKAAESGVGRWKNVRVPTLSFHEYIDLLGIREKPLLDRGIKPTELGTWSHTQWKELMLSLYPLQTYFHQYLMVGGFPEIALGNDIAYGQRVLREDVVDKVLKRDMTVLYNIRNVDDLEKIFLYLCFHSGSIISQDAIASEIGLSRPTVGIYIELLEQANLIYISKPVDLSGKKVLKARPKIYLADAALRNAVLMQEEEVLANPDEMGILIETAVYKHIASFYYHRLPKIGYYRDAKTKKEVDVVVALPRAKILVEVKYREDARIRETDAIVELANDEEVGGAIVVTKKAEDYGTLPFETAVPIVKIPAFAFLYLLGHAEKQGYLHASTSRRIDETPPEIG